MSTSLEMMVFMIISVNAITHTIIPYKKLTVFPPTKPSLGGDSMIRHDLGWNIIITNLLFADFIMTRVFVGCFPLCVTGMTRENAVSFYNYFVLIISLPRNETLIQWFELTNEITNSI